MTPVIFWGATGQARVLRDALAPNNTKLVALFDTRKIESPFSDVPIYHGEAGFKEWERMRVDQSHTQSCVAIGGVNGEDRLARTIWLADRGYDPLTVVHSCAFLSKHSTLGIGCQILAMSAVCAGAQLGDAVIINTKASVDHDCAIGNGVHIAPGATLAGEVVVEDYAFIGAGATVLPRIRVGANAVVGAGSLVTRDVHAGTTVIGNPAKVFLND